MLPITGYLDRLSTTAGGRIGVKVSSRGGRDYRADLVRIRHADPNPAGPGVKQFDIPGANFEGVHRGREQPIHLGSYGLVERAPTLAGAEHVTVTSFLMNIIPATFVGAFTYGSVLPVLLIAVLCAFALVRFQTAVRRPAR